MRGVNRGGHNRENSGRNAVLWVSISRKGPLEYYESGCYAARTRPPATETEAQMEFIGPLENGINAPWSSTLSSKVGRGRGDVSGRHRYGRPRRVSVPARTCACRGAGPRAGRRQVPGGSTVIVFTNPALRTAKGGEKKVKWTHIEPPMTGAVL